MAAVSTGQLAVRIDGYLLEAKSEIHYHKLLAFRQFVDALLSNSQPGDIAKIILFGSVARGDADWDSDVDVLILALRPEELLAPAIERAKSAVPLRSRGDDSILTDVMPMVAPASYWFAPNSFFVQSVLENGLEVFSMPDDELRRTHALHLYYLAADYLKGAKANRQLGDYRIAVDAGYNAIELAMKSFLVGQVKEMPTRHGSVNRLFGHICIVERQQFSPDFGSKLNPALELRNRARYDYDAKITEADAVFVFEVADALLSRLRDYVLKFDESSDEQKDHS